jgi:glycosyltransferase involved in cell wall biosynthesis
MKFCLVHNRYQQPGGEDEVFSAEAALLLQHGHEVTEYREDNRRIMEMGGLRAAVQTVWSLQSQRKLQRMLERVAPDIVHFHNTFLLISPSAYYACRKAGVPVVQTLHNFRLLCPAATFFRNGEVCEDCLGSSTFYPAIIHRCYKGSYSRTAVVSAMLALHRFVKTWQRQVDIYVALTEFARRKFIEGGLPEEKIMVKPNFICPDPGAGDGAGSYVLCVGRLSAEKGMLTLLKAWQLVKTIPLKIVGDGPLYDELKMFVETRELSCIEILGRRSRADVFDLMKGARFLMFPSQWYEGLGLTVIEAFACGLPVVAARLGAMREIIQDGRTGLHFAPGDINDLADKANWVWTHPTEAERMGREAREEFTTKYTAESNYKILMKIYQACQGV